MNAELGKRVFSELSSAAKVELCVVRLRTRSAEMTTCSRHPAPTDTGTDLLL